MLTNKFKKWKIYKDDAFSISFIRQFIEITFKVETYIDILDKILVTWMQILRHCITL